MFAAIGKMRQETPTWALDNWRALDLLGLKKPGKSMFYVVMSRAANGNQVSGALFSCFTEI